MLVTSNLKGKGRLVMKHKRVTLAQRRASLPMIRDILDMLSKTFFSREVQWQDVPRESAQDILSGDPISFANRFAMWLADGGRFNSRGLRVMCSLPDPSKMFLKPEYDFWRGPKHGDGKKGEMDNDSNSNWQTVDFEEVDFVNGLFENEGPISGEEILARLRASCRATYGARAANGLWEDYKLCSDQSKSVLEHLYRQKGITRIYFLGNVLRDPDGGRCILCLFRDDAGKWSWGREWLKNPWNSKYLTPVIKKQPPEPFD